MVPLVQVIGVKLVEASWDFRWVELHTRRGGGDGSQAYFGRDGLDLGREENVCSSTPVFCCCLFSLFLPFL